MVNDGIIRYTSLGCTYRIKTKAAMLMTDYDFSIFLEILANQETPDMALNAIDLMSNDIFTYYNEHLYGRHINADLVRFEKHMLYLRYLRRFIEEEKPEYFIRRQFITSRCRNFYKETLLQSEESLLNEYGIVFVPYVNKTGFKGTAMTLLMMFDLGIMKKGDLNGLIETERKYCR